jgi:formamidopyrimidine-DNA glycosylase
MVPRALRHNGGVPELPEVETVARSLAPLLTGRRVLTAEFRCLRVLRGDPDTAARRIAGRKVTGIRRSGKHILIDLDKGMCFAVHLGMTGKLLMNGAPGKHTHAILTLDRGVLLYDDSRQFGRLEVCEGVPDRLAKLGPEPLEVSALDFTTALRKRKTRLKALLLDQTFVRGVGNIYADEALFRAGIHPLTRANTLSKPRAAGLHHAIQEVLAEAIESRGSSISDYVDADGRAGTFQQSHRVYQRTGQPCVVCGSPIRRIEVAQRGTHFCAKCQRR